MFNPNDPTCRGAVLRDLVQAIIRWWRIDRIRSSPRDGQLLRLSRGTIVSVRSRLAEVVGRNVCQTEGSSMVVYQCRTASGNARLSVRPTGSGRYATLQWNEKGATEVLDEESIEVYQRHRCL